MQTITLPPPKRSWFSLFSWAILLALLVISWKGAEMDPLLLFKDAGNMATFAADFFPPDFSQWQDYLGEMAVTLQIAVWGTALAVILSIPFGLMSAENIVPWWIYQPMRRLMDACSPSCFPKPWKPLNPARSKVFAPPAPTKLKRSFTACCPRSCRC